MLRKIRITLAVVVFTLITLMFLDFTGTLHRWFGILARIQFLPALLALHLEIVVLLVLLTLIFGRIYCSVICPLGVMQDVISWFAGKRRRNRFRYSPALTGLRYGALAVFAASLFAGVSAVVSLLAPYSSYGRMATNILRPVYECGNNLLAAIAEHFDSYAFYSVDVWIRSGMTLAISVVTFLIIAFLAWRNGRTYCNTVCPVGTVLGFISRFSWLKVRFNDDKCIGCGTCARNCKASAIDVKNRKVDYSRCVTCGNCIDKCHKGALVYSRHDMKKAAPTVTSENNTRRSFLLATALATTSAVLSQEKKKVDGGLAAIENKVSPKRLTPITPPGSLSARNMARHCTSCQLCVSACPNGVLRPSENLLTLMQPTVSYERGYCRPECTNCSNVCPTGAIRPIKVEEKSAIQIGHAVWIRKNCVPIADGVECGNCARHCPAGAITMVPSVPGDELSVSIPAVNESRCIGCGACENLCPARPFSAIYVEGHEEHREI